MKVKEKGKIYDKYITTHFVAVHKKDNCGFETYYRYFKKNYFKHLPENKDLNILDIGCGMGHFLYFLGKEGYKNCLGIDISKENIEFCKEKKFNVKLCDAFEFLTEKTKHFDLIVMNDLIEHFNKQEIIEILELVNKNLVQYGKVIIKTLNASNPILANSGRYIDFTHEISFTEESLSQVLRVCGFKDVRIHPQDIYIFYKNPLNYLAKYISKFLNSIFRLLFLLYGRKTTNIFTKSIIGIGVKK